MTRACAESALARDQVLAEVASGALAPAEAAVLLAELEASAAG